MQPSPPHSFFPNFTSLQLQLPCNSSRNLGQAHNHLPSMVQENQLNSSLHNTNSPSSSFIATTRWQRKMDTCGKNTTVTTEENANGKTYSSANISIQCKIPARVSLNTRKDETVTFQSIRDEDHYWSIPTTQLRRSTVLDLETNLVSPKSYNNHHIITSARHATYSVQQCTEQRLNSLPCIRHSLWHMYLM